MPIDCMINESINAHLLNKCCLKEWMWGVENEWISKWPVRSHLFLRFLGDFITLKCYVPKIVKNISYKKQGKSKQEL